MQASRRRIKKAMVGFAIGPHACQRLSQPLHLLRECENNHCQAAGILFFFLRVEHRMTKQPYSAHKSGPLIGAADVPGDKSISHRALMFSLLAKGRSTIDGLLEGEDVLATAQAMRALGGQVEKLADGRWQVDGVGIGALQEPADVLDMGNSGTAARLLIGLLAAHPITSVLTGDQSLRGRPMARVTEPLSGVGASFQARSAGRLPLSIKGNGHAPPLNYRLTVASAQVKSALLLAALNCSGESVIEDPYVTRDHTENMLRHFGAEVSVERSQGTARITLRGKPALKPSDVIVPGDPSSAAFPIVGALIVPASNISLPNVCMNDTRTGLFDALSAMGAQIKVTNQRTQGGERVADLSVTSTALTGVDLNPDIVPRMVDEFPILAVAAANGQGKSVFRGLEELRVKESDRLAAIHAGLRAIGVETEIEGDDLIVHGRGPGGVPGGNSAAPVMTHFDHRIAMSFLIAGLASKQAIYVDDIAAVATSFPSFFALMGGLGGQMQA